MWFMSNMNIIQLAYEIEPDEIAGFGYRPKEGKRVIFRLFVANGDIIDEVVHESTAKVLYDVLDKKLSGFAV